MLIRINFKKINFEDIIFSIFCFFIFTISFLKFSVPVFGEMELTVSDIAMLVLSFVSIIFLKRIDKLFMPYLYAFLFFNFTILLSFVYSKNAFIFVRDFFPNIFAFLIIITTTTFFSVENKIERLLTIRKVLILVLFLSGLPAYLEALSIIPKMPIFYDSFLWRYAFLAQNPNQYGVASILFIFLVLLIDIMFKRANLRSDLILVFYSFVPMLYSGSRTAILSFSIVSLVVMGFLFYKMRASAKLIIAPIVLVLILISTGKVLEFVKNQGGQVNRALSIFEKIEKGENIAEIEGGTGASIKEAIRLIKSYPILGVGIGNKMSYSEDKTEIHNTYLKFLAETGIVGFIGFLSIFLMPLFSIVKSKTELFNILIYIGLFLIFAAMNYPHMLFRQRWVWFFMTLSYIIGKIALEGHNKRNLT